VHLIEVGREARSSEKGAIMGWTAVKSLQEKELPPHWDRRWVSQTECGTTKNTKEKASRKNNRHIFGNGQGDGQKFRP